MLFKQITHDDLGCASYLIGDETTGTAAVVDPRFEIDDYLEFARYRGVEIRHILETHNHADHVSGHGRLAAATGARIYIHRDAQPTYEHEPIEEGWELRIGSLLIRALHTPGHRPEHTAFLLIDTDRGAQPWAVLSGDSLLVGDVARTDLASEEALGSSMIFESLHSKLLTLSDDCELWPAHLGSSMCGSSATNAKVCSTIGFERRHNELLAIDDAQEFAARTLERLGPQPPNFERIVALNRGPLLTKSVELARLDANQMDLKRKHGALLVDVRSDLHFDDAHIPGAVVVPSVSPGFGSKLAWLAGPEQEVVFVGRDDADGRSAASLAAAVGIRLIAGSLAGGMTSWRQERQPVVHTARIAASDLARRLASEPRLQLLDVRERQEWQSGHVPGSLSAPWHEITEIPPGIDPGAPIAVICSAGIRAATGASLLKRHGAHEVIHVVNGGVPLLEREGVVLEVDTDASAWATPKVHRVTPSRASSGSRPGRLTPLAAPPSSA